jgi:hypothetical protein
MSMNHRYDARRVPAQVAWHMSCTIDRRACARSATSCMAATPTRHERTQCHRRGWLLERIGWGAMALVVAGAAVGAFGRGWLSETQAAAGETLTVKYSRLSRAHMPDELAVDWLPRDEEAVLWFARSYLDEFEVREIRPPPSAVVGSPDRIYYTFRTLSGTGRMNVRFTVQASRGGTLRGRLGTDDLEVVIRQFVFP